MAFLETCKSVMSKFLWFQRCVFSQTKIHRTPGFHTKNFMNLKNPPSIDKYLPVDQISFRDHGNVTCLFTHWNLHLQTVHRTLEVTKHLIYIKIYGRYNYSILPMWKLRHGMVKSFAKITQIVSIETKPNTSCLVLQSLS